MLRIVTKERLATTTSVIRLYLLPTIVLLVVCFFSRNKVSMYELFADPTEIANQPPYIGFFSRLGNLLWCATSSICLFSSITSRNHLSINRKYSSFLGYTGLLLGILLLDDYFEIHEYIAIFLSGAKDMYDNTVRNARDLYEGLVILVYAISFLIYLFKFWKFFLRRHFIILVTAVTFFVISVVIDLTHLDFFGSIIAEDGSKFLGIWGFFIYFTQYCRVIQEKKLRDDESFALRTNVHNITRPQL